MASMNYYLTVCRAASEKVQQKTHPNLTESSTEDSHPSSPGAYFFGRFLSFGLTPPASTSQISNPFTIKASNSPDVNENST